VFLAAEDEGSSLSTTLQARFGRSNLWVLGRLHERRCFNSGIYTPLDWYELRRTVNLSTFNHVAVLFNRAKLKPVASGLDAKSLNQTGFGSKELEAVGFRLWDVIDASLRRRVHCNRLFDSVNATLHARRVYVSLMLSDGVQPAQVPLKWAIAPADDDVRFLCSLYAWCSSCLALIDRQTVLKYATCHLKCTQVSCNSRSVDLCVVVFMCSHQFG
jgi:hypothetical protein